MDHFLVGSGTQMASLSAEEETETGPHPNQSTHGLPHPQGARLQPLCSFLIPILMMTCSMLKAPAMDLFSVGPHSPLAELTQPKGFKHH